VDASPPTEEDGYPQVRSAEHTPSARQATVVLPLRRGHRSGSERHGRVDTPKRVVIVDAENPLQEIHGEFFWREDHDRIVADEREDALRWATPTATQLRAASWRPRCWSRTAVGCASGGSC